MFGGSKGVGVNIESYGKLEISYINVDNFELQHYVIKFVSDLRQVGDFLLVLRYN